MTELITELRRNQDGSPGSNFVRKLDLKLQKLGHPRQVGALNFTSVRIFYQYFSFAFDF